MDDSSSAVPLHLLAISGSLRQGSHCTALLRHVETLLPAGVRQRLFTLEKLPPYDGDLDGLEPPEPVAELKKAIQQADGLIICSPEYNYGIPGVLKNAIDWASRPAFASPLKGKAALVITASPGALGGVRAQAQIRDALAATLARPLSRPHLAIPLVGTRFVDGRLADKDTLQMLQAGIDDLLAEIRLTGPARA